MKSPMLGGFYESRSLKLNAQRCVNLYPEIVESRDGKEVGGLFPCPGYRLLEVAGTGPIRGLLENPTNTLMYAVSGYGFYEVDAYWNVTLRGTLNSFDGPVGMAVNATQVMLVDGVTGYIYTIATQTLAEITDADFPTANNVAFIDQYFAFNIPDTGRWGITALGDGSSVDALDIVTSEAAPDDVVGLIVDHREIWTGGRTTIEVWSPGSDPDFPFSRTQVIETGLASPYAMAKLDNSLFWPDHSGTIRRADGYLPKRVSTHAIEKMLGELPMLRNLTAFGYQQEGHSFYVLSSPEWTVAYDVATNLWHERAYRDPGTNEMGRHRASCYCFFAGTHVVGDYENGNFYALDLDTYDDGGDPRKWIRSWRALPPGESTRTLFVDALRIECEVGDGLPDGADPKAVLRVSRDGGNTFGREIERSIGKTGEYDKEVSFGPLSSGADLVFELSGSDPVKTALIGAHIEAEAE